MFLSRVIGNYIEANDEKCEIYAAPFAVFLNENDINYLEPDISVICDTSKLDEKAVMVHLIGSLKSYRPTVSRETI